MIRFSPPWVHSGHQIVGTLVVGLEICGFVKTELPHRRELNLEGPVLSGIALWASHAEV